ncbi:MAG: hypothetical protein H6R09_1390 [Proteobacteria bacterium]|nr:hypothetical protein [Pseudomonadota bacterium]
MVKTAFGVLTSTRSPTARLRMSKDTRPPVTLNWRLRSS